MADLKEGDMVKLKSDGPTMTISFIENGEAYCEWFSGTEAKSRRFPLTSLIKVTKA